LKGAAVSLQFVLLPLFVHVAFMLLLLFDNAGLLRVGLKGELAGRQLALALLFYTLTMLAVLTRHADLLFLLLAWVFVVVQIVSGLMRDNARERQLVVASLIVLAIMWGVFMVEILLAI
jgi:hypothetical protein